MSTSYTVYVRCCYCGTKVTEEVNTPHEGPGHAYERARTTAVAAGWYMGEFKTCAPCLKKWDDSDDITALIIKEIIAEEKAGVNV